MEHIEQLKNTLGDYAKDIRLNIDNILSPEGNPGLSQEQHFGILLSCAYHTERSDIILALEKDVSSLVSAELIQAAKAATIIMAMNNVYYRYVHLSEDSELSSMPAKLRMNVIGKPGILKIDFELMCLAVSSMEGCGKCIQAHIHEARKANVSNEGIQSSIRIAAVINAFSKALSISKH